MKRRGVFKVLHQVWMGGASYIESQSGVMLAEAGRSVYGENRARSMPLRSFCSMISR